MKNTYTSNSRDETEKLGEEFAKSLSPGDVVCLYGELGAGKTVFVKGLMKGIGIEERVTSPTFTLIHEYNVNHNSIKKIYHIDLYRLENIERVKNIGILELFNENNAVVVIEWAEKMGDLLPKKRVDLFLKQLEEDKREIQILSLG